MSRVAPSGTPGAAWHLPPGSDDGLEAWLALVRCRGTWGVRVDAGRLSLEQPCPVNVAFASGPIGGRSVGYSAVETFADGFTGIGRVGLAGGARLVVTDTWRVAPGEATVERDVSVQGGADDGFLTSLRLARAGGHGWADVEPFAPGAVYGACEPVPARSIGSPALRRSGVRHVLVREDRLAAPLFALRYPDGDWLAVLHRAPKAGTTAADAGEEEGGETLVDGRFGFASLGGVARRGRLEVGVWFPGAEGEVTYTSGGLPLRQRRAWRRRYHPLREDVSHRYRLAFRLGTSATATGFYRSTWRWAWEALAPTVAPVEPDTVVRSSVAVLAGRTVRVGQRAGIPLEADAVTGRSVPAAPAIMGFVGANTDAAALLLRVGRAVGGATGSRYRELGERILDSFAAIGLDPPQGEGFDPATGRPTTYRRFHDRPAVYARSVAEGCAAAVDACREEAAHGSEQRLWLHWAKSGGDWLVSAQRPDGSFPRAWEAGTGAVLDGSSTASYAPIAFLAALARATGDERYLESALRAGEFSWWAGGKDGCFAGATLDNPDVVDKEAAVLSLEGFLALHQSTGDDVWRERAVTAAELAETWIYAWSVPMPVDADAGALHWKPGVPTVGQQLIATGVSMCDGFLAVNAAAFAALYQLTGDRHFLEVARVVTHGTKAMLARPGRTFDLCGEGWQQEHWCFAVRRGYGLNRNWLPWVSVASAKGILRLQDLGGELADLVLGPGAPAVPEAAR